jgi:hypothetical protein
MEKSSFFNSINGDRKYKAEEFAAYFASFISNGIFPNPSANLQVLSNNDMTVTIKKGKAWINGYFYENTDDLILGIDNADGVLNRIDRVVVRLDKVTREIRTIVKKGTFASSPVVPELTRNADIHELGIAEIKVNKGAVSIVQSNITDTRFRLDVCGVTNSLITVDVELITNQFSQDFNVWFDMVKDQLGEDAAGNLQNQIGNIDDPTLPAELKGKALTEQTKYVLANAGKVKSVNSKTGEVQLTGDDIPIANGVQSSISTNISDLYNSRIRKSGDTLTGILNLQANTSWINATLINGWTGTIKYRKDACGVVHVTGNCSHNTPAGAVFQLPVGYRPQYDVMETAFTLISEYILCTAELYPTGDLYIGRGQPHKTIYFNFSFIAA